MLNTKIINRLKKLSSETFKNMPKSELVHLKEAIRSRLGTYSQGENEDESALQCLLDEIEAYQLDIEIQNRSIQEANEDLSKRNKQLQKELSKHIQVEETLQKLSRAIEQSPCTVMITDVEGMIEYVNPKFTELTGYTPEEVMGKNPRILKPDKIPSEKYSNLWRTITSGNEWSGEFCNRKKNGDLYWEYGYISPVKNQLGVITNFIAVKEDITERIKAEEELRKFSRAIEQSPCTVIITNTKGIIEYVNPKFTQLTGYTLEEVIGKSPRILKPENIPSENFAQLWKTLLDGKEWQGEFCNKKKSGEIYWEYAYISPMRNLQGKVTHFIAVKEDITEHKLADEERNKHIRDLEDLMLFSTRLNKEEHDEELFRQLASALQLHFEPDLVAIVMIDKEKNMLYAPVTEPPLRLHELVKEDAIYDPLLCGVLKTGEKDIVEDINEGKHCDCIRYRIEEGGYMCFPLNIDNKTTGMVFMTKKEIKPWKSGKVRRLISNYIETTGLALQKLELLDIAKHTNITDELTGVYNKRYFKDLLIKQFAIAKRRNEDLSLLILTIDQLAKIKDMHSTRAGNLVLQQMTSILSDSVSDSDIIARYGDEEFVILMPSTFTTRALVKADSIRQRIEFTSFDNVVTGQPLNITLSIGVASFPENGAEPESLVTLANKALKQAKEGGGNKVAAP